MSSKPKIVDSMTWLRKKKIIQYDTKGHFFDFIMATPRIPRIVRIANKVVGGSIKLCDMGT